MNAERDDFVEELQSQILDEARAAYGDVVFERWLKLVYMGAMNDPDGYAGIRGTCGDKMEIFLGFDGSRVERASFLTDGCGASAVCGSFAAELAHGKTPEEILEITGQTILAVLGGLPEDDRHCAFLAAETLQEALRDYMNKIAGKRGRESGVR